MTQNLFDLTRSQEEALAPYIEWKMGLIPTPPLSEIRRMSNYTYDIVNFTDEEYSDDFLEINDELSNMLYLLS